MVSSGRHDRLVRIYYRCQNSEKGGYLRHCHSGYQHDCCCYPSSGYRVGFFDSEVGFGETRRLYSNLEGRIPRICCQEAANAGSCLFYDPCRDLCVVLRLIHLAWPSPLLYFEVIDR